MLAMMRMIPRRVLEAIIVVSGLSYPRLRVVF